MPGHAYSAQVLFASLKGSWPIAVVALCSMMLYAALCVHVLLYICIRWQPLVPNLLENVNGVAKTHSNYYYYMHFIMSLMKQHSGKVAAALFFVPLYPYTRPIVR